MSTMNSFQMLHFTKFLTGSRWPVNLGNVDIYKSTNKVRLHLNSVNMHTCREIQVYRYSTHALKIMKISHCMQFPCGYYLSIRQTLSINKILNSVLNFATFFRFSSASIQISCIFYDGAQSVA